jgi:fructosamine-3-kinase
MVPAAIHNFLRERLPDIAISNTDFPRYKAITGGSINQCYCVQTRAASFFLKINSVSGYPGLFLHGKEGLECLSSQNLIRVPHVLFNETLIQHQLLLLEWIEPGPRQGSFWKIFGEQLARLHMVSNSYYGFTSDNYMGSLPQANPATTSWKTFFIENRLQPQIEMAAGKGLLSSRQLSLLEKLIQQIGELFNEEPPALLHGDLWSGNFICDEKSQPVLIDPAVYFGHRSIDLAMTTLFGGFDKSFYEGYHFHYPLSPHHQEQWDICNLYPLLVHLNLFGSSYLGAIETTLKKYCRD